MQATSQCCRSASITAPLAVSDDPFTQLVVLDYYDGPARGFLKCKVCGAEYYIYLLDWDDAHLLRIFALAPIPDLSLQRLFALLQQSPDRHVWIPPVFSRASEEVISDLYNRGIQDIINRAATPSLVIAWSIRTEKAVAIRGIDAPAVPYLYSWFDHQPRPVVFDWFGYLHMVKL